MTGISISNQSSSGAVNRRYLPRLTVWILKQYQRWISPLLPSMCRFEPTCSAYARQCFGRYSWLKALWLTGLRLLRCHPYCKGGFDPVP